MILTLPHQDEAFWGLTGGAVVDPQGLHRAPSPTAPGLTQEIEFCVSSGRVSWARMHDVLDNTVVLEGLIPCPAKKQEEFVSFLC